MSSPQRPIAKHQGRNPNSNGKPTPINLYIPPSVKAAEEDLARHAETRISRPNPGDSKAKWAEYTSWVNTHSQLKTALEMARKAEANTWKTIFKSEDDIQAQPAEPKHRGGVRAATPKLTIDQRICEYNTHISRMERLAPGSPEWETERQGLYHQRRAMREAGYQIPANLAPVPTRTGVAA